ncbi:putative sulfate transporter [Golovinomyces cichoracearum]|uniref:Putative sulfate transporter n=1 Tax=Golovinomyces cichoracearum TaxID=62708 RepID=A0A420H9X0_9PEZI|nr:putative sulfate transporter [Golovinomyces cichoracearum]
MKPTASNSLRYRHRRICSACSNLDLMTLISPALKISNSENDSASESHGLKSVKINKDIKPSLCKCSSVQLWLCKACAQSIRNADMEYQSIWRWSVRFLPSLGGLGIGLGEADRGVSCGRGENCARAREVKLEIDCDAEDAREINDNNSRLSFGPILCNPNSQSHGQMRPGYHRHEVEGIGGVLKKKLVKMVKVGACVSSSPGTSNDTWSDGRNVSDKEMENILEREIQGTSRSWCSWCQKIIPSHDDNNIIYSEPISIGTD